jgi:glycosyltransferase involved in cell wall biosynthesis
MNLFLNYYRDKSQERQNEIDACLRRNIESGLFAIHVFKEPETELPEFARHLPVIDCPPRLNFSEIFEAISKIGGPDDVNIVANADIYFDDTIRLAEEAQADEFYAITRYTVHSGGACTFYGKTMSQDAWIFRGTPRAELNHCVFQMGRPRCDSRLAFEARSAGYRVSNPSLSIKIYHLHCSGVRNYDFENRSDAVPGDILHLKPRTLEEIRAASEAPAFPFVSVIIPVYNDMQRLKICLDALRKQTYPGDKFEVIVADNGSKQDLSEIEKGYPFSRVIHEAAAGSYAARNSGIDAARGEVLAFTDSDCIPARGWLENAVRTLIESEGCGMVGGAIELFFQNSARLTPVELYEYTFAFPQRTYIEERHWGATANLVVYREVFETVGRFNTEYKSGGDQEWGKRVFKAGYKQVYCADSVVQHPARRTFREIRAKDTRVIGGWYIRHKHQRGLLPGAVVHIFLTAWGRFSALRAKAKPKGIRAKTKVTLVIVYLVYTRLCEAFRLWRGGEPKRA